jgi:D-alanyl-D-alanine-carboxypeptidase/D-alanyl-D-alanine-endopeptidase
MMRAFLLGLAIAMSSIAPASAQALPDDAKMLELIKTRVDEGGAKGIVLGVIDKGKRRVVAYGDPGPGAKPLGPDTVFEIGSVTKVFTGILLADMQARGEVNMTVPAQTYAPNGLTFPKRNGKEITLELIASQRSGLPRLPTNMKPANMANPYADYTVAQLHEFVSTYDLPRDPGASYEYSNLGLGLLGHILASRTGKTYEQLVSERIILPLGMTMTSITLTPKMTENLAKGHDPSGNPAANWDLPTLAGAGALRSTANDMLTFLDANMGAPKNDIERAMRESHRVRASEGDQSIGLAWGVMKVNGRTIITHDGGTGGYGAFIAFDPDREIGVVLLNNTQLPEADIAMHVLAGTPLKPAIKAQAAERVAIDLPKAQLEKFVGVYALDSMPSFQLTVTLENGGLQVQATGQGKAPVYPEAPNKFFYRIVDAQLTFTEVANGQPPYLTLHQMGMNQKATKVR